VHHTRPPDSRAADVAAAYKVIDLFTALSLSLCSLICFAVITATKFALQFDLSTYGERRRWSHFPLSHVTLISGHFARISTGNSLPVSPVSWRK